MMRQHLSWAEERFFHTYYAPTFACEALLFEVSAYTGKEITIVNKASVVKRFDASFETSLFSKNVWPVC